MSTNRAAKSGKYYTLYGRSKKGTVNLNPTFISSLLKTGFAAEAQRKVSIKQTKKASTI